MGTGTGKTLTAIRAIAGPVNITTPAIIFCRRDDVLTWELELEQEGVTPFEIYARDDPPDDWLRAKPSWVIVTYDRAKRSDWMFWIQQVGFRWAIADEAQYLRGYKSQRTKAILKCIQRIPNRLALTATPIGNDLLDVFSIAKFIDNGQTLGDSWWSFRNKYYIQSGPGWYKMKGAKERLGNELKKIAFSVDPDDVLKLPPRDYVVKGVPMSGEQRRYTEKLVKNWEYEIQEGNNRRVVELSFVIAMIAKLKQVATGFIYDDNKQAHHLRSHKYKCLIDLLKDGALADKSKVVVWGSFRAELDRIAETLKKSNIQLVKFYGADKNNEARTKFEQDPAVRVFLGQADMGVGMNQLVVADSAVYFSNSVKSISRTQSEGRIRRRGSERHKRITYFDLLTEKSIEVKIHKDVKSHRATAAWIVAQLKDGVPLRRLLT